MARTMSAEVYNEISDIDEFQEMLELADEIRDILLAYIQKNSKNKDELEEIKVLVKEFERKDLNVD
jgi:hypothetical protein